MLLVPIIFGILISVNIAKGLRVCDDFTTIHQCPQAMNLARRNRSRITLEKFRNATCGIEKERKICCSDFEVNQLVDDENVEDEIENHPNLQLLTNECGEIAASRLLGGRYILQHEVPWLVLIATRVSRHIKFDCEGSLISSNVLTTAHCIMNKHVMSVRIGDYNMRTNLDCSGQGDLRKCEERYQVRKNYSKNHEKQIICVGELRPNSCIEGEGAPLMLEREYNNIYKYIQYGIQSHGPVQCGGDVPGIYIDVRRFMKWILDSIEP